MADRPASASRRRQQIDVGAQQVAAVYAKALLGAAENAGVTDVVLGELDSLLDDVLTAIPQLDAVLSSALVEPEDKQRLIDRALGSQASPTFLNFLKVLARHGRLGILRTIRQAAHAQYDQLRGRVSVEMVTAAPLDGELTAQIEQQLRQMLGGEPRLVPVTDPDLIGGIVLRVGDTVYDGSVATRLERMREQMINRSVHEIQRRRDRFSSPAGN